MSQDLAIKNPAEATREQDLLARRSSTSAPGFVR
jgi:hypothetical protein